MYLRTVKDEANFVKCEQILHFHSNFFLFLHCFQNTQAHFLFAVGGVLLFIVDIVWCRFFFRVLSPLPFTFIRSYDGRALGYWEISISDVV